MLHENEVSLKKGKFIPFHEPSDYMIISTGSIGYNAFLAAKTLREEGVSVGFISSPFIKPIDLDYLKSLSNITKTLFIVEEHHEEGGFGSAVLEAISNSSLNLKVKRLFISKNLEQIGSQSYMLRHMGLDAEGIIKYFKSNIKNEF